MLQPVSGLYIVEEFVKSVGIEDGYDNFDKAVRRTDTFLGARYRRIAKRRGNKRAIVAVGRSILVIVWHLLASDDARFTDLGADHFTKHLDPDAKKRNHIRQLEALGYTVTLTPAA